MSCLLLGDHRTFYVTAIGLIVAGSAYTGEWRGSQMLHTTSQCPTAGKSSAGQVSAFGNNIVVSLHNMRSDRELLLLIMSSYTDIRVRPSGPQT
jgi:hypothetical protein